MAGFTSSAISSGNLKGALQGSFTAVAFYGAGSFITEGLGGVGGWGERSWQAVAVHAVVGCITSSAAGNKCGPGALAAGLSQAITSYGPASLNKFNVQSIAVRMVVGGTVSVLGGGKFANGANSAAFGYIFNSLAHAWAGTEATYALADRLNARDGADTWLVNRGSFWDILLDGRADLVNKDRQTFEVKTNRCLADAACQLDAEKQLNRYITSSAGEDGVPRLTVGNSFTVFRGDPSILAYGTVMGVETTFSFNPTRSSGLIGYDIVDETPTLKKIWESFFKRKSATDGLPPTAPIPMPPLIPIP